MSRPAPSTTSIAPTATAPLPTPPRLPPSASTPPQMSPLLAATLSSPGVRASSVRVSQNALGRGSFGSVFRGTYDGCPVAVKVCTLPPTSPSSRTRPAAVHFRRETARFQCLRHPCIVQFFGVVSDGPRLQLMTELMEGGSLFSALSYLKQAGFRALPPQDCLRLSRQVTNGLAYLHASAFSFGDLKTLNILLSATPNLHTGRFPTNVRAKLCDFGLSRNLKHLVDPCDVASNPNATQIPAQHGPAGTFAYLAPEAFAGLPTDDPDAPKRADIYALGIVLWELATLQTPWPGLRALQLIRLVGREGRRPEWPENVSHLSQGYIDLVERCWHQDPALRPSAEQVASELEAMYCAFGDTSESGLDLCTHMEDGESSDMLPRARNDSLLGTEAGLSVDSDSDVVRVDDDEDEDESERKWSSSVYPDSEFMSRTVTSTITGTNTRSYPSSIESSLSLEDIPDPDRAFTKVESMMLPPDFVINEHGTLRQNATTEATWTEADAVKTQNVVRQPLPQKKPLRRPSQRAPSQHRLEQIKAQRQYSVPAYLQEDDVEQELAELAVSDDKWQEGLLTTSTIGFSDDRAHGPSKNAPAMTIVRTYSVPAGLTSSGDLDKMIEMLDLDAFPDISSVGVSMDTRPHFR